MAHYWLEVIAGHQEQSIVMSATKTAATATATATTKSHGNGNITDLPIDLIVDRISNLVMNRNDWNNLSLLNHEIQRKLCTHKQNAPWPTSTTTPQIVESTSAASTTSLSEARAILLDVGSNVIPNELPYRGQPFEIRSMALSSRISLSSLSPSSSSSYVDHTESNDVIQEDWIACACNDGNIRLWNRQSGKRLILPANDRIDQISFFVNNDNSREEKKQNLQLISCGISPQILVYDIHQLQLGGGGGGGNRKSKVSPSLCMSPISRDSAETRRAAASSAIATWLLVATAITRCTGEGENEEVDEKELPLSATKLV